MQNETLSQNNKQAEKEVITQMGKQVSYLSVSESNSFESVFFFLTFLFGWVG